MRPAGAVIEERLGVVPILLTQLYELKYLLDGADLHLGGSLDDEVLVFAFMDGQAYRLQLTLFSGKQIIDLLIIDFQV